MSSRRKVLAAASALAAIVCAYTWPLPVLAGTHVAHDRGDPLLVTWILWWTSHAVPLTTAWWNAPAFYPSPGVLAYSENLLSLAPLTAPIIWLTGSPVLAYNAAFLSSYVLSGLGAYLLGFVLTRSHGASFVAAVAYGFAPYRLSHTQHLQLLSSYWMPVAVAALHLYVRAPLWRWAVMFAAAWVLQALASGYYLFFLTTFVGLWMIWFVPRRLAVRDVARLGAAWAVGAVLLAPVLLGYRSIHAAYGFRRSPVEIVNYSADVSGLLSASPDSLLWSWLRGPVGAESEQFPGLTLILLLAILPWLGKRGQSPFRQPGKRGQSLFADSRLNPGGDAKRGQPPFQRRGKRWLSPFPGVARFYGVAAGLTWMLSLGPAPRIAGTAIGVPGPYALLAVLPGFDGMRVPARFWMVAVMCLAAALASLTARIESARIRRTVIAIGTLGMLLDAWPRTFPVVAAPGMRVTSGRAPARLGLPLHEAETETMFGAIAQGRPVFNGYSGYAAPQHPALRDLLEHHDPRILSRIAAREPVEVVVETSGDADGGWNSFVQQQPHTKRINTEADWTAYEIAATGDAAPERPAGPIVPVTAISTTHNLPDINAVLDGNLDTRWHTQPQAGGETITVDVGSPRHVTAVVLCLGAYAGQYPRRLQVDVSADSSTWTTVYTGGTALEAYDAALRAPREIPITVPVARDAVRYLRLRQTGREPRTGWTIVELRIIG